MKLSVGRIYRFDAAHSLPHHLGACRQLHGHTYLLEVTVSGELQTEGPSSGMVLDFGELDEIVEGILEDLDHSYLNDFVENPTAELLCLAIHSRLLEALPSHLKVERLRLWETPDGYAEISS